MKLSSIYGGLLLGVLFCGAAVQAQVVNLENNISVATINLNGPGTSAGLRRWMVGGANVANQEWFWYRAEGMTQERPINDIGGLSFGQLNANTAWVNYFNAQYGVRIDYQLHGSTGGTPYSSDLSESMVITNASLAPLEFHFFQYAAMDFGSDATVRIGRNLRGLFNEASVSTAFATWSEESAVTRAANRAEVDYLYGTLGRLSDNAVTTLNNNTLILGSGAYTPTWALEWDLVIPAQSWIGIVSEHFVLYPLPEPSSAAILLLGVAGSVAWRSGRNKP